MREKRCQINGIFSQLGFAPWKERPCYSLWAPMVAQGPAQSRSSASAWRSPSYCSFPSTCEMRGLVLEDSFRAIWSLRLAFAKHTIELGPGPDFFHFSIHSETRGCCCPAPQLLGHPKSLDQNEPPFKT